MKIADTAKLIAELADRSDVCQGERHERVKVIESIIDAHTVKRNSVWTWLKQAFCLHDEDIISTKWVKEPEWHDVMKARMGIIENVRLCKKCGRKWTERALEFATDEEFRRWMDAPLEDER